MALYDPILFQLPICEPIEIDEKNLVMFGDLPKPLLSYGFNTFIYDLKNKMEDTKNFNKLELNIANRIDIKIKNYNMSLSQVVQKIFPDYKIISRAFYKLWEMLMIFNLVDTDNFVGAFLCESPGSFVQATLYYRKYHSFFNDKDRYYVMSLDDREDERVPKLDKSFIEKNSKYIFDHPTTSKGEDNGDILKSLVRNNFKRHFDTIKEKADLVTADVGKPWENENYQAQEGFVLILSEACLALKCQKKNGHFVLKIFESFTNPTIKLIALLQNHYENIFIHKPLTSHDSNSERYIICHKFKDNAEKTISIMEHIIDEYNKLSSLQKNIFVNDILLNVKIDKNVSEIIKKCNIESSFLQCKTMQNMVSYMEKNKGIVDFNEDKEKQIQYTTLWCDIFLLKNYDKKILEKLLKSKIYNNIKS